MPLSSGIRKRKVGISKKLSWPQRLNAFSRHPLTLVAAGFIFTSIVGTVIQTRQQRYETEQTDTRDALEALAEIRAAVHELYTRVWIATSDDSKVIPEATDAENDALAKASSLLMAKQFVVEKAFPYSVDDGNPHVLSFSAMEEQMRRVVQEESRYGCLDGMIARLEHVLATVREPERRMSALIAADRTSLSRVCPSVLNLPTDWNALLQRNIGNLGKYETPSQAKASAQ